MTAAEAINDALRYYDPAWAYHHMLHPKQRQHMDELLVARRHPLAFEAGTNEGRFRALHRERFQF